MVSQKEFLQASACRALQRTRDFIFQSASTATHVRRSESHAGADLVKSNIWTLRTSGYSRKSATAVWISFKFLGQKIPPTYSQNMSLPISEQDAPKDRHGVFRWTCFSSPRTTERRLTGDITDGKTRVSAANLKHGPFWENVDAYINDIYTINAYAS